MYAPCPAVFGLLCERCLCMQLAVCHLQNWQTAEPKPADCHRATFSEGRAMQIVKGLATDLPHRQACRTASHVPIVLSPGLRYVKNCNHNK